MYAAYHPSATRMVGGGEYRILDVGCRVQGLVLFFDICVVKGVGYKVQGTGCRV